MRTVQLPAESFLPGPPPFAPADVNSQRSKPFGMIVPQSFQMLGRTLFVLACRGCYLLLSAAYKY
jgi:hypothetical protein